MSRGKLTSKKCILAFLPVSNSTLVAASSAVVSEKERNPPLHGVGSVRAERVDDAPISIYGTEIPHDLLRKWEAVDPAFLIMSTG